MKGKLAKVPEEDVRFTTAVCDGLLKLGCRTTSPDSEIQEWCASSFPHWKKGHLLQYFLPKKPTILISPVEDRKVMQLFDSEYLHLYNDDSDKEELVERGLLIVGADVGGSWVCVNTKSDIAFEIVAFDQGDFASFGYSDSCVARTGRSLDEFLTWIYDMPMAYLKIWNQG